jgi:hypothetical protein
VQRHWEEAQLKVLVQIGARKQSRQIVPWYREFVERLMVSFSGLQ